MKPIKIIRTILIILLVIILALVIVFTLYGDRAIKTGIEKGASTALKVPVTLDKISLSVLAGKVQLKNLIIKNPPDYQHEDLLELGEAFVDVRVKSLLSDTVNIETLKLDSVALVIEQKGLTNNLQQILDSLPAPEPKEPKPEEEAPGKNLLITQMDITNVNVKVKLLPIPGKADTVSLKLAPITMTDLGKDGKLDVAALTAKILAALAAGIAQQGADILPTELIGPIQTTLKEQGEQIIETGKELIDTTTDVGKDLVEDSKDVIESGKDVGKEATDLLKDIFKKKDE